MRASPTVSQLAASPGVMYIPPVLILVVDMGVWLGEESAVIRVVLLEPSLTACESSEYVTWAWLMWLNTVLNASWLCLLQRNSTGRCFLMIH